jgi:hypothetical protein
LLPPAEPSGPPFCTWRGGPALAVPADGAGADIAAPTLLPPFEPAGPPFCTLLEDVVLALDPVGGAAKALPTALPPVEPCGPALATWAHAAGAASITATAIIKDFVITFLQRPKTVSG